MKSRNLREKLSAPILEEGEAPHWASVLFSLDEGRLELLALYLRSSDGLIDQAIAKKLIQMIEADATVTGWHLRAVRNRTLAPRARGPEQKIRVSDRDREIADYVAVQSLDPDHPERPPSIEAGVAAAMEHYKLSRSTVFAIWDRWKTSFLMRTRGLRATRKS